MYELSDDEVKSLLKKLTNLYDKDDKEDYFSSELIETVRKIISLLRTNEEDLEQFSKMYNGFFSNKDICLEFIKAHASYYNQIYDPKIYADKDIIRVYMETFSQYVFLESEENDYLAFQETRSFEKKYNEIVQKLECIKNPSIVGIGSVIEDVILRPHLEIDLKDLENSNA